MAPDKKKNTRVHLKIMDFFFLWNAGRKPISYKDGKTD